MACLQLISPGAYGQSPVSRACDRGREMTIELGSRSEMYCAVTECLQSTCWATAVLSVDIY